MNLKRTNMNGLIKYLMLNNQINRERERERESDQAVLRSI